ncbi:ligand-binding protein SH3 [Brevibacterium sp. 5221]|uniref:Ligand-binding protein SH3 n=1 Tax=Brevibacterium rongguiense TaxID=2695267 RepID=A0A6N9H817_9MICO|nr:MULTISPECIES: ligand-binding protein SH3 [Brevibacterium]MYM20045.1 ligand-binding protein SH3 [Brevibacterium rongguiense]WAL41248.1 ligand-binding protein SH3 [Brevibacterium sp. BRM-1]
MGKHSDPKPSWGSSAADLVRSARPRRRSGRHGEAPSTATGVMRAVKRRPMVAAIALPAAAIAAVAGSTAVFAPRGADDGVVQAEQAQSPERDSAPAPSAAKAPSGEEQAKKRIDKLAADPKYRAKGAGGSLATPEPSPAASSSGTTASAKSAAASSAGGVSNAPCSVSSSVEQHFKPNASKVYRAVCAKFPQVKTFGGYRNDPGSDHGTGHAVDIMISGSTGDEIRDYVLAHRKELGVKYVIWKQRLYAPYTSASGRHMDDRGSQTANHFDHVHVSVN